MTPLNHEVDADEILIDRLIEGELDDPARRSLLLRLDALPDGWRRLALAFLEAQAWRQSLGKLAAEISVAPASEMPRRRRGPIARAWLARAAALLVVFGVGWRAGRSEGPGRPQPPSQESLSVARPAEAPRLDPPPASEAPGPGGTGEVARSEPVGPPIPQSDVEAVTPWLSEAGRDRLQRQGYEVQRRPAVAAVQLRDGRRAVIPVEDVMVRYVGARVY